MLLADLRKITISDVTARALLARHPQGSGAVVRQRSLRSNPLTRPSGRLPQLDGLRAVAVALVVIHHALGARPFGGFIGVDIFFVLSGFLISRILFQSWSATGSLRLRRFYLGRLLRLYPALLFSVATVTVVGFALGVDGREYQVVNAVVALSYTTNVFITATGHYVGQWSHTWSLATEEQFYLLWPAALLVMLRAGARSIHLAAVLVVVVAASATFHALTFEDGSADFNPLGRAQGLALGCLLAVALRTLAWQRWVSRRRRCVTVAGAGLLLGAVAAGTSRARGGPWCITVASVGAALVIAAVTCDQDRSMVATRVLAWRPLVYLGAISYGIYLWHLPLLALAALMPHPGLRWSVLALTASVGAAAISHRWVEAPFMRLKVRLGA